MNIAMSCCILTLTLILTISLQVHGVFLEGHECLASGRFRYRDPYCRSYFLCVKVQNSFVQRSYTCPHNAIFNPSTNRCSVQAHCIDNICQNLPKGVTKIPDPNGDKCQTYIECVGKNDQYPVIKRCDIGYFNKDLPEPGCWFTPSC